MNTTSRNYQRERGESFDLSIERIEEPDGSLLATGAGLTCICALHDADGADAIPEHSPLVTTYTEADGVLVQHTTKAQTAALDAGTYYWTLRLFSGTYSKGFSGRLDIVDGPTVATSAV